MSDARMLPISTPHLHRLIQLALLDLRRVRRTGDRSSAARCENRLDALLDQLCLRTRP